ncbi:hotdog fold thioesterase [Parvicella tangerina]|uniref:Esterase n=1 Tax=Parvicella tangerina TaxID=2829795 RepID=A0A916JP81_9FLAO|nr:hotdog fold thioesterase [Parvicella tangerina]CAG5085235.1 Putative esterase [Parvicella tangerina]
MLPKDISLKQLNAINKGTLMESLGIEFTEIRDKSLKASMPVDERTFQPMGLLHGGANVALAESLGSVGTYLMIDTKTHYGVCIEINANHVGSVMKGSVVGTASLLHKGKTTHIWNVEIRDESERLISYSRMTIMILERK